MSRRCSFTDFFLVENAPLFFLFFLGTHKKRNPKRYRHFLQNPKHMWVVVPNTKMESNTITNSFLLCVCFFLVSLYRRRRPPPLRIIIIHDDDDDDDDPL